MTGKGADIGRDRHIIVVEDHQQVGAFSARVIEGLEGHARGQAAVADDRHRAPLRAGSGGRDRHAERGADRGAGMADPEGVVFALVAFWKRREALPLANGMQAFLSAGQDFMDIGLMPHVPDQPIIRRIV